MNWFSFILYIWKLFTLIYVHIHSYAYHKWIFVSYYFQFSECYEKYSTKFFVLTSVSLRDWTTTDVENFVSFRASPVPFFLRRKIKMKIESEMRTQQRRHDSLSIHSYSFIKILCRLCCNGNEHREHIGGMWNFSSYLLLMAFFKQKNNFLW